MTITMTNEINRYMMSFWKTNKRTKKNQDLNTTEELSSIRYRKEHNQKQITTGLTGLARDW